MKRKFEIKQIKVGIDPYGHEYLDSFWVKDENGSCLYLDVLICDCFPELDEMTADEQVDWGRDKIGKHVFCDDITSQQYVAVGKTYIV